MKLFSLRSVVRERTLLAAGVYRGCSGVYAVAWIGSKPKTLFRVRPAHMARKLSAWWGRQEQDFARACREWDGGSRL